jgi:hypothetical protein
VLIALPVLVRSWLSEARPPVMIDIIAMPTPAARMQVHKTTSPRVMSGLIPARR